MSDLMIIKGATFLPASLFLQVGYVRKFTVVKDGMHTQVRFNASDENLIELMNKVVEFEASGDPVDLVVQAQGWSVGKKSGTLYYLRSIEKGN